MGLEPATAVFIGPSQAVSPPTALPTPGIIWKYFCFLRKKRSQEVVLFHFPPNERQRHLSIAGRGGGRARFKKNEYSLISSSPPWSSSRLPYIVSILIFLQKSKS